MLVSLEHLHNNNIIISVDVVVVVDDSISGGGGDGGVFIASFVDVMNNNSNRDSNIKMFKITFSNKVEIRSNSVGNRSKRRSPRKIVS